MFEVDFWDFDVEENLFMCVCPTNLQLQVLRLSAVIFAKNFVSEVKTLKFNREFCFNDLKNSSAKYWKKCIKSKHFSKQLKWGISHRTDPKLIQIYVPEVCFTDWWQEVVWWQQKGGSVGPLGSVTVVRRSLAVFIISKQLARLLVRTANSATRPPATIFILLVDLEARPQLMSLLFLVVKTV